MKVVAINLRPDKTQIIEGTIKKDIFNIQHIDTMYPIFPNLLTFRQDAIDEYFYELKERLNYKKADVYIGFPDDLFKKIDCAERDYVSSDEWDKVVSPWINQVLKVESEDYHVITPLHFVNNNKSIITGIAIRSTYVDTIYKATVAASIKVKSIEPSSYAMLRLLNQWDREYCIMEVWEKSTSMVGYSNIRGMFNVKLSKGWSQTLTMEDLVQSISSHDYSAYTTYNRIANTNIPIYLISDKKNDLTNLLLKSEFASRLKVPSLPQYIESKIPREELLEYVIPLGLGLAALHERMIDYANTNS